MKAYRFLSIALLSLAATGPSPARAHCDTEGGPLIPEARAALEKGDATPVLKWVRKEDEEQIKQLFATVRTVRDKGPEAKKLADRHFLETLVRLHRAGEGEPFTGIKEGAPEPFIVLADKTLAEGNADPLIKRVTGHLEQTIREKHEAALKAAKNKDRSVEEGRAYVAAYVTYLHYLEGVHKAVMQKGGHGHEEKDDH